MSRACSVMGRMLTLRNVDVRTAEEMSLPIEHAQAPPCESDVCVETATTTTSAIQSKECGVGADGVGGENHLF